MIDSTKTINLWTREDFESLPYRKSWNEDVRCNSIVIIPSKPPGTIKRFFLNLYARVKKIETYEIRGFGLHDSGFRCMDFAAVDEKSVPLCLLSGCSDIIHFDGIGGYGYHWSKKGRGVPRLVLPSGWTIDCLDVSGFLHAWPGLDGGQNKLIAGPGLSSMELFCVPETKIDPNKAEILPPVNQNPCSEKFAEQEGGVNEGN